MRFTNTPYWRIYMYVAKALVAVALFSCGVEHAFANVNPAVESQPVSYTQKLSHGIHIGERLMLIGDKAPSESESEELWNAFCTDNSRTATALPVNVENFVKVHPNSSWNCSVRLYLGNRYLKAGYFSLALDAWEAVWKQTRALSDHNGQQLADASLVNWLQLLASLGRVEKMKELFNETANRSVSGDVRVRYDRLQMAYSHMIHHPEDSYRCGTMALDAVTQVLYGTNNLFGIRRQKSPESGFSMAALESLSKSYHLGLVAVQRTSGNQLVTPSVVHWKENHYAAIVKRKGDVYEVEDPTFQMKRWLSADAINHESSGQFLVLSNAIPAGWRYLTFAEGSQIFGKGFPNGWDPYPGPCGSGQCCAPGGGGAGGFGSGGSGGGGGFNGGGAGPWAGGKTICAKCSSGPTGGMPQWHVIEPDVNIMIDDEPLAYQTSTGGRFSFKMYFTQGANTEVDNGELGRWGCSWMSEIDTDGYPDSGAVLLPPGGGTINFTNLDGTAPEFHTKNRLLITTNSDGTPIKYQLFHPNGAVDLYEVNEYDGGGDWRFYLTQQIDPHGRTTTISYDLTTFLPTNVIDSDGRTNNILYTNIGGTPLISAIQTPYSNIVSFGYDSTFLILTNVTDVAGLSTSFTYQYYDWLTNMITPYGMTSFTFGSPVSYTNGDINYLNYIITAPNGQREMFMYGSGSFFGAVPQVYTDTSNVPTNRPVDNSDGTNTLDNPDWNNSAANDYMNLGDTFYWNADQFASLNAGFLASLAANGETGGTFDLLTNSDYAISRMRHYNFWDEDRMGQGRSLSMERQPSPDGITPGKMTWYDYPGKPDYDVQGSSAFPSMIIEVLPDGSENYTIFQTDQFGNQTNVISNYSENGVVMTRTNQYVYATNGIDLLKSIGPDGVTTGTYGYDSTGLHLVLFMTNAVGDVTSYTYNTNAQVTSITQPTGLITTNFYDANGLLTNTYDYSGSLFYRTNAYTYTNGLVLTHTDERGLTTTNSWDALMRLTGVAYPDGTGISYTYSNLDLVRVVDRLGFTNSYGYNSIRQRIAATNALGSQTLYSYCLCGGLDGITDPMGNITSFGYDYAGRLTSKMFPDGSSIANHFDSFGRITNVVDGSGMSVTNWYNNQGLIVAVSNAFGQVKRMMYDINDRVTNEVVGNGVKIMMTYDPLGRILTRTYPDGGVESFGYSAAGLLAYTNQLTNATYYAYDAARRKIGETNANNQMTQYGYDAASDLTSLTDQKSNTTQWGYDSYGRVTNKVDATTATILTYDYDADSRLTNRYSAQKGNTEYKYDPVGNLTNVVYPASHALAFSYDSDNRMTSMSDAVGTTSFTYTQVGQLASETGPWASDTVAYTYADRLRTKLDLQQPNAADWGQTYGYDAANRMDSITSPAGTFTYDYNPGLGGVSTASSLISLLTLPNGAYITNTFDGNARMLGTWLKTSGGSNLDASVYTYNVGNQRTAMERIGPTSTNTAGYMYDSIGQVLSDTASEGTTNRLNEQLRYGFDPAGNLAFRTNNGLLQNFAVNSLNELTSNTNGGTLTVMGTTTAKATSVTVNSTAAGVYGDATFAAQGLDLTTNYTATASDGYGRSATNTVTVNLSTNVTFQYDLNGNLTNDGLRSFAYDDENQLIQVWVTNQWMSQFTYDGKMRRRIRQEFTWNGSGWTQTNAVYYVYDGNLVIQERDVNNLPTTIYTRGKDLSGSLEGAGGIGGLLARTAQSYVDAPMAGHAFYHSDGNGNVTCLINGSQAIVAKYLYDAFGNVLSASGVLANANRYQWSGKEKDINSGLVYYLYRYYDPNLQRWPNRDPIENGGFTRTVAVGLDNWNDVANVYRFVNNDPNLGIDAQGLTVYVCSRKSGLAGIGNHSYFYDSSAPPGSGCQSCGSAGSSGGSSSGSSCPSSGNHNGNCPGNSEKGPGSPGVSCAAIPGSDGSSGQSIMNCCKNSANNGVFWPGINDCHNAVNRCLPNGMNPPINPRFGPPYVGPMSPP